jgi:hypothetical protein
MKTFYSFTVVGVFFCFSLIVSAQSTVFVPDQQSASESVGGGGGILFSQTPVQSFTPINSSLDYVRLWFSDASNGIGATVAVNIRAGAVNGQIIGTSASVFMPDAFGLSARGFTNFIFANPVSLNPGTTYYLEPILSSGSTTLVGYNSWDYTGGNAYFNGVANANWDLWFAEGVIVPAPEPGTLGLLAMGFAMLAFLRRQKICG